MFFCVSVRVCELYLFENEFTYRGSCRLESRKDPVRAMAALVLYRQQGRISYPPPADVARTTIAHSSFIFYTVRRLISPPF